MNRLLRQEVPIHLTIAILQDMRDPDQWFYRKWIWRKIRTDNVPEEDGMIIIE